MKVELATLSKQVPRGSRWIHELKYDGYRILAHINGKGLVRLETRNGNNWTDKFRTFAKALALEFPKKHSAVLDGELVAQTESGRSDFSTLQKVLIEGRSDLLIFYAFDLLVLDGKDLRGLSLKQRKALLEKLLKEGGKRKVLRFSPAVEGQGEIALREACRHGFEGIVSKRTDTPYRSGRGDDWLKVKCTRRQEMVIAGYTAPKGSRVEFGALLLGYYDGKKLRYAGKVGTGFNTKILREVRRLMKPLERKTSPFSDENFAPRQERDVTWLKPQLVAEIEFSEWTHDDHLRHPVFLGIREDKAATKVVREEPV